MITQHSHVSSTPNVLRIYEPAEEILELIQSLCFPHTKKFKRQIRPLVPLDMSISAFNPFKPNGLAYPHRLVESISNFRYVEGDIFYFSKL